MGGRRAWTIGVVSLGIGLSVVILGSGQPAAISDQPAFPQIGSNAPDFSLVLLDEDADAPRRTVHLSDFAGRFVYLDVFGTWCLPCQLKYAGSADVVDELEAMNVAVLGLLFQDDPDRARRWFTEQGGMHYPFAVMDEAVAADWGILGAPMGFLISPDGTVERRCFGCDGRWSMDRLPGFVRDLRARMESAG